MNSSASSTDSGTQLVFGVYTYPIDHAAIQYRYRHGVSLITTSFTDVPSSSWPKNIKVRSRVHYYLAQRQAAQANCEAAAFPILLDGNGTVSDSSTASIAAWSNSEGLVVRPTADRYDSISLTFLSQLAKSLGMRITERCIHTHEVQDFDEFLLVSTPWCAYPVKDIDGVQLSGFASGSCTFNNLMQAWEDAVGIPLRAQH